MKDRLSVGHPIQHSSGKLFLLLFHLIYLLFFPSFSFVLPFFGAFWGFFFALSLSLFIFPSLNFSSLFLFSFLVAAFLALSSSSYSSWKEEVGGGGGGWRGERSRLSIYVEMPT